jgi:uncharacterized protein (TIGR03643 family)
MSKNDSKLLNLSADEIDRVIRMAWEDRTSFEAIRFQFELTESETIRLMRLHLSPAAFRRWRKRANQQGHLKHEQTRPFKVGRFKCNRQRLDGSTKGWK